MKLYKKIIRIKNWILYGWMIEKKVRKCGTGLHVNSKSIVSENTVLGDNVHFNGMKIWGNGTCKIGNNFHSGQNCQIITQNHNYDTGTEIPYDSTYIKKDVLIGDNVWLGNNVIILGGITIGEGAIIQAGSVVSGDIPPCAIAGGNPAKIFKMRDETHYNRLKQEGRFH